MTLISEEYLAQLREYREGTRPLWGNGGKPHVKRVTDLIEKEKIKTVLDYGCGHGLLLRRIVSNHTLAPKLAQFYDPGIEKYATLPKPAQLVISTDVLEHIEHECLDDVLDHIHSLTERLAYLAPHTGPAKAILPDGRNAHLIQESSDWWQDRLCTLFSEVHVMTASALRPVFLCAP